MNSRARKVGSKGHDDAETNEDQEERSRLFRPTIAQDLATDVNDDLAE